MRSTRPSPLSLSAAADGAVAPPGSSSPLGFGASAGGRKPLASSSLGLNGLSSSSPSSGSSSTASARRALFKATPFSTRGGSSGLWHDRFISACADRVRADRRKAADARRNGLDAVDGEAADEGDADDWGEAEEIMLRRMVQREWTAFKRGMTRQAELVEGLASSEIDRLLEFEDDVQPPDMDDDDALAARFESFIAQSGDPSDAAMDTDDPSSTPTGPAAPASPADALVRSTLASACPSCGAPAEASSMATAPDALGVPSVGCRACHWSLPLHVLDDAAIRFQSLRCSTLAPHSLGIACVPFVGTLLLCSRCDEQLVLA